MSPQGVVLDPTIYSPQVQSIRQKLKARTVGQDHAADTLCSILETAFSGYSDPLKPVGIVLELGPTGVGKTSLIESLCDILYGNPKAYVRINCAEFRESQQTNRFNGAPPGYIGFKDKSTNYVITQEQINKHQTKDVPFTIVLLDEIEKAHLDFYLYFLSVFNEGEASVNGESVDFRQCLFVMTSNLGVKEASRSSLGFQSESIDDLHKSNTRVIEKAVKEHFPPEFINRIDHKIIFQPLSEKTIGRILEVELGLIRKRILDSKTSQLTYNFSLQVNGRQQLVKMGFVPDMGARPLRRVLQENVVDKLAMLVRSQQISHGDLVLINHDGQGFTYSKYYAEELNALSDPQWEDFKRVML